MRFEIIECNFCHRRDRVSRETSPLANAKDRTAGWHVISRLDKAYMSGDEIEVCPNCMEKIKSHMKNTVMASDSERVKYVFIDVDGVLNRRPGGRIENEYLANFHTIVQKTGARVVVSSSWREESDRLAYIKSVFGSIGINVCNVIDCGKSKAVAIDDFVKSVIPAPSTFCIIDDDPNFSNWYPERFVHCRKGLDFEVAIKAIRILGEDK